MIALRRLNGDSFILNSDLIETVEATPDTVVKLVTGRTIVVRNSIEDIVRKVLKFKQLCGQTMNVYHKGNDKAAYKMESPGKDPV